jgi:signal transduction histidine kinase
MRRQAAKMLLWLVQCLLLALPVVAQGHPADTLRLIHAEVAYGEGTSPPERGWIDGVLPEFFSTHSQASDRTGWYRFVFNLDTPPEEPLVLLVQRVVLTAEFRLNGSLLNPGVRFEQPGGPPGTQMLNWPHWIVLPAGLFKAGRNELLVKLRGNRVTPAWISGISIGRPDELRGEFLLRDIPQRLVPQTLLVLLFVSLFLGLRLWWRERLPLQGQVVTTSLLWLANLGVYFSSGIPLPWRTVMALIAVLWIGFHWSLLHLLWRLSNGGWAWFPRALSIGSAVPVAGALLLLAVEPGESMFGLLMLPTTVLRCLTTVLLVRWAWRERSWSAVLLTGSELLWFAGPVQLMLVVLDVITPDPFMLAPGNALPMVLVMLWLAAQRLAQQREEAALQRQVAVLEERQRMMMDMHDGIGSQLVTALRMARRDDVPRPEVAQVIQDALHDLRLIIDAQDGAAQELQSLLHQWRDRHQARLESMGPRLTWDLAALPTPRPLSPPEALQILRILQEALNNAVQHARPTTIAIALAPVPGGCELRVSDDGAGMTAARSAGAASGVGRGLDNMQRRAGRLGARLEVRAGEGRGTVVNLLLPDATQA